MSALPPCSEPARIARLCWLLLFVLAASMPSPALAHKASDSYLFVETGDDGAGTLRWDIALRDLDQALGLDRHGDRLLRWGEVRERLPTIIDYASARLLLNGGACTYRLAPLGIETRIDGAYLALAAELACKGGLRAIDYRLLAELDPTHRGLLRLDAGSAAPLSRSLDPNAGRQVLQASGAPVGGFFADGLHHILIGYDHMLFLLCLLLPAVLRRTPQGWTLVDARGRALWPLAKTITLFTIAHSLTLALATLDIVRLPPRLVETGIAASIVLVAVHNLRPLWRRGEAPLVFAFGLIHGMGFANVLAEMSLPPGELTLALLNFNLGVEAGQLLAVGTAAALIFALRARAGLVQRLMPACSMLAIAIGGLWLIERSFDLRLIS